MTEIQIPVRFDGILIREDFLGEETAKVADLCVAAISKPAAYVLTEALPYDFILQNYMYRITEPFDGTLSCGDDQNPSRYMEDADFVKAIGKKSKGASRLIEAGKQIKLYLGTGTIGSIEFHMTGFYLKPTLLMMR